MNCRFQLSPIQAEAIVNMRLRALTGLEVEKLEAEWRELTAEIARLQGILADKLQIDALIAGELDQMAQDFKTERRTEIGPPVEGIDEIVAASDDKGGKACAQRVGLLQAVTEAAPHLILAAPLVADAGAWVHGLKIRPGAGGAERGVRRRAAATDDA